MPKRPPHFRPGGRTARDVKRERDARYDPKRAQATPWRAWYSSPEWRALRAIVLTSEPACRMCLAVGRVTPTRVADHIIEHKGDRALFFDRANLQGLCFNCHNSAKQKQERAPKKTKD